MIVAKFEMRDNESKQLTRQLKTDDRVENESFKVLIISIQLIVNF